MAAPSLVQADWAKGKVDTYKLSSKGIFSGYMQPPNCAYAANTSNLAVHPDALFMSCRGRGPTCWTVCSIVDSKLSKISPGTHFPCSLALMLGVSCIEGVTHFNYIKWEGLKGRVDLNTAVNEHSNTNELIFDFFHIQ